MTMGGTDAAGIENERIRKVFVPDKIQKLVTANTPVPIAAQVTTVRPQGTIQGMSGQRDYAGSTDVASLANANAKSSQRTVKPSPITASAQPTGGVDNSVGGRIMRFLFEGEEAATRDRETGKGIGFDFNPNAGLMPPAESIAIAGLTLIPGGRIASKFVTPVVKRGLSTPFGSKLASGFTRLTGRYWQPGNVGKKAAAGLEGGKSSGSKAATSASARGARAGVGRGGAGTGLRGAVPKAATSGSIRGAGGKAVADTIVNIAPAKNAGIPIAIGSLGGGAMALGGTYLGTDDGISSLFGLSDEAFDLVGDVAKGAAAGARAIGSDDDTTDGINELSELFDPEDVETKVDSLVSDNDQPVIPSDDQPPAEGDGPPTDKEKEVVASAVAAIRSAGGGSSGLSAKERQCLKLQPKTREAFIKQLICLRKMRERLGMVA